MEPRNEEQQLGYIISKLETLGIEQQQMAERLDKLAGRVEEKFKTAEMVMTILKFSGIVVMAILTLKFGDISKAWATMFH